MNLPQAHEFLPVSVRAWPGFRKETKERKYPWRFPNKALFIDTETQPDDSQALWFGSAKLAWIGSGYGEARYIYSEPRIIQEVIFYADDLEERYPEGWGALYMYCRDNGVNLISQDAFVHKYLIGMGMQKYIGAESKRQLAEAIPVFFNAPFDLSRLAYGYHNGRGANRDCFGLEMQSDGHRTLIIRHIDSKKQIITPESVLDLHTLVWAMTNRNYTLESACRAFQVPEEYSKGHTEEYGKITPEYIEYNRQDVTATAYLACAALKEYFRNPIDLSPVNALSPATIGKAYLEAMGVTPILDRANVPKDKIFLGNTMSSFYGGRAECNIRRTPVPVKLLDFNAMYSTVNALMRLWRFMTAESIELQACTDEVQGFLDRVDMDRVLDPSTWPELTGYALVIPDGDILPVRAAYDGNHKNASNVGDSYLYSKVPFWFSIPDLVNSKIRTGKAPRVIKAVKIVPRGQLGTLKPIRLMGEVYVDPVTHDFFQTVIEIRANVKAERKGSHDADCKCRACKNIENLKVTSNSTSYGITVEVLRMPVNMEADSDYHEGRTYQVYGMYDQPFEYTGTSMEVAQKYCYPPIGGLITGAARLMLGILEALLTEYGGVGVFRDTDSTAVAATDTGGYLPCPGGSFEVDGQAAIKLLSRAEINEIQQRLNKLNPYQGAAGKEILKTEVGKPGHPQYYAYAISAKRYCLFSYDENDRPVVASEIDGKQAYMEHGLGLYMDPRNLAKSSHEWMRVIWQLIVDQAHGITTQLPWWIDRPALTRSAVTSPHLMRSFKDYNAGKSYRDQVKPFGFMLLCSEIGGESRRLVAPYSKKSEDWVNAGWRDLHNPMASGRAMYDDFQVKTFRDVLREHPYNIEIKMLGPDGRVCGPSTQGLLFRRTVRPVTIKHIGKESNNVEGVEDQLINNWDEIYTDYGTEGSDFQARTVIRNLSADWVADLINQRSVEIRGKIAEAPDNPLVIRLYGNPVQTIKASEIRAWVKGRAELDRDQIRLLTELAARCILDVTGVKKEQILWGEQYSNSSMHTPKTLLALWMEMGCPAPDGYQIKAITVKRREARENRMCEHCGYPMPGTRRADAKHCSEKCRKLAERKRARARKREVAA